MLPLALAIGEGAEQRAPMARAVIGGLITSTLLTLLVVPVMSTVLEDMVAWFRTSVPAAMRRMRGGGGKSDDQAPKPPPPARKRETRPPAPEPVAAMHLSMAKETGKD
jgi:HAE1 family hydrophobic/amphiphilic exporter-1